FSCLVVSFLSSLTDAYCYSFPTRRSSDLVLDPLGISGGGAGSVAGIDLILVNPGPQGFGVDSELVADTAEDAAAGTRVGFECVEDHADCSLAKLERVFLLGHDREVLSVASLSPLFPGRFTLSDLPGVATRCFSPWRRPT